MLAAIVGKQTVAVIEMSSQDITMPLTTCAIVIIMPQSEHEHRRESQKSSMADEVQLG